jgi:hypothetical protein
MRRSGAVHHSHASARPLGNDDDDNNTTAPHTAREGCTQILFERFVGYQIFLVFSWFFVRRRPPTHFLGFETF